MLKLVKTSLLSIAVIATSVVASDILVTVNGKNITKQDAQAFVSTSAPQVNFMELTSAEKKMVTDRLIEEVLFTELAEQEGIDKKPSFKRNMEILKSKLLVQMWMQGQMDNTIVSDSEAKAFYDKNTAKFMEKSTIHARHILLKNEKDVQDIIDKLKPLKGGELKTKFIEMADAELAKNKLKDPNSIDFANTGGDLGTVTEDKLVPEFSQAALALEEGQITTQPVKTQFGYHVIYLEKKSAAKPKPYETEKDKIITLLKQQQFSVKITEIAKELKSKAKIVDMASEVNTTKK